MPIGRNTHLRIEEMSFNIDDHSKKARKSKDLDCQDAE
jgi:hypothetical protein